MPKRLTNSALIVLMTSALLSGGCLACSHFSKSSTTTTEACCNAKGHCDKTKKPHTVAADCGAQFAAIPNSESSVHVLEAQLLDAALPLASGRVLSVQSVLSLAVSSSVKASRPDLCLLQSVLRV